MKINAGHVGFRLAAIVIGLVTQGCGGDEDLATRLAGAGAGDTVTAGAGTHQGPLTVPAGVELVGQGDVIVTSAGDGAVVTVETAKGLTTTVDGIEIVSQGKAGLLVKGAGAFDGDRLDVKCSAGVGVAAEGLASLRLDTVTITGDITPDKIKDLVYPLKGSGAPIIGLALSRVSATTLSTISISGFGGIGAAFVDTTGTWKGGAVADNVGIGVIIDGGRVTLDQGVKISKTRAGERGATILSFGLVITGKSVVTSKGLTVSGGKGYGILQQGGRTAHEDLILQDNNDAGLWIQNTTGTTQEPALKISGISTITGNRGGGLIALASGAIEVMDATLSKTRKKTIVAGVLGAVEMGDGVQLAAVTGPVTLKQLKLPDNARVGVLLSGKTSHKITLDQVSILGGGEYGLIPELDFPVDPSWTVTRDSALEQADKSFTGSLGVAKALGGLPTLADISQHGLLGQGGLLAGDSSIGTSGPKK